jgi:hypothetical protein
VVRAIGESIEPLWTKFIHKQSKGYAEGKLTFPLAEGGGRKSRPVVAARGEEEYLLESGRWCALRQEASQVS